MSKMVFEGVPEVEWDDGKRSMQLIMGCEGEEESGVFVKLMSWEEGAMENIESWHPELRDFRGKKLRVTIEVMEEPPVINEQIDIPPRKYTGPACACCNHLLMYHLAIGKPSHCYVMGCRCNVFVEKKP